MWPFWLETAQIRGYVTTQGHTLPCCAQSSAHYFLTSGTTTQNHPCNSAVRRRAPRPPHDPGFAPSWWCFARDCSYFAAVLRSRLSSSRSPAPSLASLCLARLPLSHSHAVRCLFRLWKETRFNTIDCTVKEILLSGAVVYESRSNRVAHLPVCERAGVAMHADYGAHAFLC